MTEQTFYSTYARYVISRWAVLVGMIREFAVGQPITNIDDLEWQLPTLDQIKEAIYKAPKLVRISFDLAASFQKTQKIINNKYDIINRQFDLVSRTLKQALKNVDSPTPPPIPIQQLEQHLQSLQAQKNILENLIQKIEELEPNLDELIKNYEDEWEKIRVLYAHKAIQQFETSLNLKFSDAEKAELLKPTKNKIELLEALKKYQLESLLQ